jgi:hypothetical protein
MTLLRSSVRAVYAPALFVAALLLVLGSANADTTLGRVGVSDARVGSAFAHDLTAQFFLAWTGCRFRMA